ncbi:thymidylate synthase [Bosea sp. NPDC003192]|uniref:thymidylate synthase n=1 Tax=Bosea sp. NPDC003192 TaxID=3390551 RepID=UPI003D090BC1
MQSGRGGDAAEVLHATLRISDPRQRWVLSRRPAINPAFAIAEAFWILGGRDDAQFVNFWNPALPRYAGGGASYHGAYGKRLRDGFGFDQIERAIDALSGTPTSRQVVLQIWDPRIDAPRIDGSPATPDIPCNICSILKIRNNRLEWLQVMRSNDIFRGTPYNIIQFTIIQEYIAGCVGVELGDFILMSDSLHAYEADLDRFSIEPSAPMRSDCTIALDRARAAEALRECGAALDALTEPKLKLPELQKIVLADGIPRGHADLLRIAAADSARRRGWASAAFEAAAACTDALLRKAWTQWAADRANAQATRSADLSQTPVPLLTRNVG